MKLAVMPIASLPLSSLCLNPDRVGKEQRKEEYGLMKAVSVNMAATESLACCHYVSTFWPLQHLCVLPFAREGGVEFMRLSHHQGQTCLLQQRRRHQTGRLQPDETQAAAWPSNLL